MNAREAEADNFKQQGNACVKQQKYAEAVFHYTNAIKLDPQNYSLYSNRSFAFLMIRQYYFAMEDALMTIQLKPDWSKGYFRKGEVELRTSHFSNAFKSYNKALSLQPDEPKILEAMSRASRSLIEDRRADQQIPWLGAGVGIILAVIVIIADYTFSRKPAPVVLTHAFYFVINDPLMLALLTMAIAMLGFVIAKSFRYFIKYQRNSLLKPPVNFFPEEKRDLHLSYENIDLEKNSEREKHPKYSKAQARQRFRRGKS